MLPVTALQTTSSGQAPGGSSLQMLLLIIPLLICCMLPMLMRRGQGGAASTGATGESDVWFTSYKPDEAFEIVKKEVENWRQQAVETMKPPPRFSLRKPPKERFIVTQSLPPRLYRLSDPLAHQRHPGYADAHGSGYPGDRLLRTGLRHCLRRLFRQRYVLHL